MERSHSASRALLVAAPMALEARLLASAAPGLCVRRTGMGRRRSRAAAARLSEESIGLLVVMGLAGGLDEEISAGDVIVARELCGPAGERVPCPAGDLLADVLREGGIEARRGVVSSVPRPVFGSARARLRVQTGALAADMESLWLAGAAPPEAFAVVRVIADAPSPGLWRPWRAAPRFLAACRALREAGCVLGGWAGT